MAWRLVPALAVFFLLARAAHSATPVSCLDADGNAVDWWIALKVLTLHLHTLRAWHTLPKEFGVQMLNKGLHRHLRAPSMHTSTPA